MAYMTMMCQSVEGPAIGWRTLPFQSFYHPPSLPPLSHFTNKKVPTEILSRIVNGEVIEVDLHMIAISHKGSKQRQSNEVMKEERSD